MGKRIGSGMFLFKSWEIAINILDNTLESLLSRGRGGDKKRTRED